MKGYGIVMNSLVECLIDMVHNMVEYMDDNLVNMVESEVENVVEYMVDTLVVCLVANVAEY